MPELSLAFKILDFRRHISISMFPKHLDFFSRNQDAPPRNSIQSPMQNLFVSLTRSEEFDPPQKHFVSPPEFNLFHFSKNVKAPQI